MENQPQLDLLCEYYATLAEPLVVGNGPYGMRQIFHVTGGEVTGPRLRGRVLPSGADWILIGADGVGRLDVRAAMETHDGAILYVHYIGILHFNEATMAAIAGGRMTEFGETIFYVNPRVETGDPRYAWLNGAFLLNQGRLGPGRVEYRMFEVK